MPFFTRDGIQFNYEESGAGQPFVFQHGLGADLTQPLGLAGRPAGIRVLAFDCRAHGRTAVGPVDDLGLGTFAEDLVGLLDTLKIARAVVGGISMGAAVALNVALRFPDRLLGLVLLRPAWLDGPNPWNVRMFSLITALVREHGAAKARQLFERSEDYRETHAQYPDVAKSLIGQFDHPDVEKTAVKFERLIKDAPCWDRKGWHDIGVPTLVLGNRQDPVHPFEYAEVLASGIPGARLVELTSKSVSVERHELEVRRALADFLQKFTGQA